MDAKINDIKRALECGCFLSALSLSLTLPDICGSIEYPKKSVGRRYMDWFDTYVYSAYKYEGKYKEAYLGTEFDGKACYSLRCAFLHSGNTFIENKKLDVKINHFDLCHTSKVDSGIYADMHGITTSPTEIKFSARLDVRSLCINLYKAAENYYQLHSNKNLFADHSIQIIVLDEEADKRNIFQQK